MDQGQASSEPHEWRTNWKVVFAAAAGMSLAALSTSSFGVMLVPIERDLGWSRAEISSGPLLITAVVFSLSTLLGGMIDRFGPRAIGAMAVLIVCGALALMSQISGSLWTWWTLWALAGLGSAVMPTVWLKPVSTNFKAGRGLALALVLCGSGISSFVVPMLANRLVEAHGWRLAYVILAGIWCAWVLPLVLLFLRGSRQPKLTMDIPAQGEEAKPLEGLTLREGFSSPRFYVLLIAVWCSTFLGTAIVLNFVPVLLSNGFSSAASASIAGMLGFSIIGRFASGWLLDRVEAGRVAAFATLLMIALPGVLLLLPRSTPAAMAGVLTFALMSGALLPSIAYLTSKQVGARNFGTFYGTINAVNSIGVGLGPMLANHVYDRTGSYTPVLLAAVPMFVVGASLFLTLRQRHAHQNPIAAD